MAEKPVLLFSQRGVEGQVHLDPAGPAAQQNPAKLDLLRPIDCAFPAEGRLDLSGKREVFRAQQQFGVRQIVRAVCGELLRLPFEVGGIVRPLRGR